ncbi:M20/M25/M40 family metallo-hydrolase [Heyndrickxia acidicola]|uniref:M20/M25/M40 family metallo-hydrolase n=1 Tax=Heyndrickxia acidicola TaxID=209389 RepID=A0ABU6MMI6_9BACI|nr:M20/M25/M40 family metallo-hydrolase [Heyndrickxia acidicola]MED1204422.1 M20/M25/M40 family metallo-hydrolase [Heyndrickxia acidicola]
MPKWKTKEQVVQLLCELVQIPSITGSQAERVLPDFVIEQLSAFSYFQKHPDHLQKNPVGDGRHFVTALVKKNSEIKNTVILVSHFDVVDVQDYGVWKEYAFQPKELTSLFYRNKDKVPEAVRDDIASGNWLFGRGTMDMKCGLALHMAMIEKAIGGAFDGNILLLAVPDEEVNSAGMRAAVPRLLELAQQYGLDYTAVLNSEPMFTQYPGDQNKYIYTGSIGKVLPGFYCYGKETHVGEPFAGLNANFMASILTAELELNTELCEMVEGEAAPPPTNLLQKDLKEEYSVQIPHRAVTLFNLFLLEKTMADVVFLLHRKAIQAAAKMDEFYAKRAAEFAKYSPFHLPELQVKVLTYEELVSYAIHQHGKEKIKSLQQELLSKQEDKDDREATIEAVDKLAIMCKELAPMIVLFFTPPYYPAVSSRNHPSIKTVTREMAAYALERHGITFKKQNYFGGISDLSYVGLQYPADSMGSFIRNFPLWDQGYSIPLSELEEFDVPVINLGPTGRDAHQWTERLDIGYSLDILLDMLPVCIQKLHEAPIEMRVME